MPIRMHYVEPNIYRAEWLGEVTIEEVITEMQTFKNMASSNGDDRCAFIVDLTNVKRIPFDVSNLRRIADSDGRVVVFVIVKPPVAAQVIMSMLMKLSVRTFQHAKSLEEGLQISRQIVAAAYT